MINFKNNSIINQISFISNTHCTLNQNAKISFNGCDRFTKEEKSNELCPDSPPLANIRDILRSHILNTSGIYKTDNTSMPVTTFIKQKKKSSSKDITSDALDKAKVSFAEKRAENLYSGGRLDASYVDKKVTDILKSRGITHIIYLKQDDVERYKQFADENGFKFVNPANPVLAVALDLNCDLVEESYDDPDILDDFRQYITNLNNIIQNNICYIGCELGTVKTEQILYYLSALNDNIKVPDIKITDEMKRNFEYLKQFKK